MNEPTPQEAATALRAVHESRELVIRSVVGSRWLSVGCGLVVFLYCAANDLFPTARPWLGLPVLALLLVVVFGLHSRTGSALLGRPVAVSNRTTSASPSWRLLRLVPLIGIWVAAAVIIPLLHTRHGAILYGALVGLYIIFVGPRFQLWLLRRRDKD